VGRLAVSVENRACIARYLTFAAFLSIRTNPARLTGHLLYHYQHGIDEQRHDCLQLCWRFRSLHSCPSRAHGWSLSSQSGQKTSTRLYYDQDALRRLLHAVSVVLATRRLRASLLDWTKERGWQSDNSYLFQKCTKKSGPHHSQPV
jgi:hypothetical protein